MSVGEQLRAVWRRASGMADNLTLRWEARPKAELSSGPDSLSELEAGAVDLAKRRTLALPSILSPYGSGFGPGAAMPKPTQANLRRFAETPVVRRAINVIKDRIAAMDWQVRIRRGVEPGEIGSVQSKLRALRRTLEEPNATDSFRTLLEQAIEDALTGGYGAIEMEATGDAEQPAQLWPVDGATVRVNGKWDGTPDSARYEQVVSGQWSVAEGVPLRDDQLIYIRMNPRSFTPFGLGPLEVAFETVNQFLSAHRFAGKLAANSVVQYALWLNEATPSQHERMIRWWQDEIEGTGRVPLISTEQKPEVLRFAQGTDADLRLEWQQFLIRMVANAFGLPPLLLGLEGDVNRTTAAELADEAFRGAIEPLAKLIAQHITRDLFAKCIGWREFEFVFNDLSARDEDTELAIQVQLLAAGVYTVSQVALAAIGAPPTAVWIGTVTEPAARSSLDCRNAARALVAAASSMSAAWSGTYATTNVALRADSSGDVWPGDALLLASASLNLDVQVAVRAVTLEYGASSPDVVRYAIEFSNDWANDLAIKTSRTVPADAWLPAAVSPTYLANLTALTVTGITPAAVSVAANVTPPSGGGFEVRRRDFAFRPGQDVDLVMRSVVGNFDIPRTTEADRFYIRMYDGNTPPNYSEFSVGLFVNLPLT